MTCGSIRLTVTKIRAVLTLLSAAAALTLLASAVRADCPTNESASNGFTMKTDRNIVWEITGHDGDATKIVETLPSRSGGPDAVVRHSVYRGLITVLSARADYTLVTAFEPALRSLFPLTVGKKATFRTVRRIEATPDVIAWLKQKPEVAGTMDVSVVGNSTVRIGNCSYEAILVDREMRFDGEQPFRIRQHYLPDLRVTQTYVFARENPGKEPTVSALHFTSIASK